MGATRPASGIKDKGSQTGSVITADCEPLFCVWTLHFSPTRDASPPLEVAFGA